MAKWEVARRRHIHFDLWIDKKRYLGTRQESQVARRRRLNLKRGYSMSNPDLNGSIKQITLIMGLIYLLPSVFNAPDINSFSKVIYFISRIYSNNYIIDQEY